MSSSDFNFDHYRDLLKTAFKNENYEEAYRYATLIIENDPYAPAYIWADKGLCAGHLSTLEKPRIREMVNHLKNAISKNSDNNLNTDFIAVRTSYIISVFTDKIMDAYSNYSASYAEANRTRSVVVPQKSMSDSIGAGLGAGIADAMSANSQRKKAAQKLGVQFKSAYQAQILEGLEYAWSVDQTENVAKNIFYTFEGIILATGIDAETKKDFIHGSATQLISEVKEKYPDKNLPNIPKDGCSCFIATAVMGDYDHPYVKTLRQLRDQKMQKTWAGRNFIAFYYRFSPPVAHIISKHDFLRVLFYHILIRPIVKYANFVLESQTRPLLRCVRQKNVSHTTTM